LLSLDAEDGEARLALEQADQDTPDSLLEKHWVLTLRLFRFTAVLAVLPTFAVRGDFIQSRATICGLQDRPVRHVASQSVGAC
jgi:hypothetical protein